MDDEIFPRRRRGESFGKYWHRLNESDAIELAMMAKRADVLPQSYWSSHIKVEGES